MNECAQPKHFRSATHAQVQAIQDKLNESISAITKPAVATSNSIEAATRNEKRIERLSSGARSRGWLTISFMKAPTVFLGELVNSELESWLKQSSTWPSIISACYAATVGGLPMTCHTLQSEEARSKGKFA
jgi:hypothetical protein